MHVNEIRENLRDFAVYVTIFSAIANAMPKSSIFNRWPKVKGVYEAVVNFVSISAMNIRECLPSLDIRLPGNWLPKNGVEKDKEKDNNNVC